MDAKLPPLAAIVQMTSGIDPDANLRAIDRALGEAAKHGAAIAFLPEMSLLLDRDRQRSAAHIVREADSPWPAALQDMARRHGVWLHSGSMPLLSDDGSKRVNRSHVIAADGSIRARYDKIHMFDVTISETEAYAESKAYRPGAKAVLVQGPVPIGLSVCYDLRFPQLFRALAQAGARILTVPAAFNDTTGAAHWHVLLRARAIETGCFVLAPAQCGLHAADHAAQPRPRRSFGHSLAVSPWGEVLGDAGEGPGILIVSLDLNEVDKARSRIPAIHADQPFEGP